MILFPNNENPTFLGLFLFLFTPCSIDDTVRPPAAINILARSLILRYSACAAGYNSLPVPVHVRHFLQLQGARPPPEPSPIRNYKLQVGSYAYAVISVIDGFQASFRERKEENVTVYVINNVIAMPE